MIINLRTTKQIHSKVFCGRTQGASSREIHKLNKLDKMNSQIVVKIPRDTISINSSFFLGMFGESVRELGVNNFKEKYKFECSQVIQKNIERNIERAVRM